MTVEALNCPNCGAGVASDHTQCEFCKTRLKTVGCSKCLGLMFVGNRFCGHCGAIAAPVEVSLEGVSVYCPRCREPLEGLRIGDTGFSGCTKCDGLWVGVETFENVCADREKQSAVLGFLKERDRRPQLMTKISYVPCPDCSQLMNRSNFARASGVIVDICKRHGVWCDADELPTIVEFIQKGGMEIARQREKNELREERDRLRDERQKQAMQDQRFGMGNMWDREREEGIGIRAFVQKLFE
jgi:Zn-finger nucleic acid-binding protein